MGMDISLYRIRTHENETAAQSKDGHTAASCPFKLEERVSYPVDFFKSLF